jgi:integrase
MGCLYKRKQKYCTECGRLASAGCRVAGHAIEVRELPTIWIKYYQGGRAVRESTGTTKETVARRMLRAREGDVEHGIPIDPKMGKITFEDAQKDLLNDYKVNGKKTHDHAKRRLELHLEPFFRGKRLISITTSDVLAYVAKRQADQVVVTKARTERLLDGSQRDIPPVTKPTSNGEINRELSLLKRMFTLAVQAKRLHAKPHIPMLREDNVRRGFLERKQFEDVRDFLPVALRPVVTFAYLTGWRMASEILPLEWRQIDMKAREVRLDPGTTKNGEGRTFPFTAELEQLMKHLDGDRERLRKSGKIVRFVFRRGDEDEQILDLRAAWKAACRKGGVPGRILHDFRRTAVRNLELAGVSRSAAMAMVGHKTEAIYRRYAIVDAGALRDAAAKIDRAAGTFSGTPMPDASKSAAVLSA